MNICLLLSIMLFPCRAVGSFLRTSSVNIATWAIFGSLMPKVETWRDIFFSSLLSAIVKVSLSHSGNISRQVSLKAQQSEFFAWPSESLRVIAFNVSIGKSKSITGRSSSSPSINSCKEWPSRSVSIASISSALSAPRKCLGLTLSSRILYKDAPISEALYPW